MSTSTAIPAEDHFSKWVGNGKCTLLPDPDRAERWYTVISCDDHVVEPPDAFTGRVSAKYADLAPRVVRDGDVETWLYDGRRYPNVGFNAVAGRPLEELTGEPTSFSQMRRGAWDIHSRIADMDLDGVWASTNFPSFITGFGGTRLQLNVSDLNLALEVVKAYNDWHIEEWAGAYPDRIIPVQIPWLHDPEIGAAEIYRNAERGYHALSFPESPHKLGWPSVYSDYWDPMMRACEETETVLCLHTGSGGSFPATHPDAPLDVTQALFGAYAMFPTVDLLFSKIPLRFPDLKICMTEGGIGWVAGLLDRLDHADRYTAVYGTFDGADVTPSECLKRNFWFCALQDPSSFVQRHRIGVDHILLEVDYPHGDTSWPNTQVLVRSSMTGLPAEDVARFTWRNASELFRHPVPHDVQVDPNAY